MTNYEKIIKYDAFSLATFLAMDKMCCQCCIYKNFDKEVCMAPTSIQKCFIGIYHWLLSESEEYND